MHKRLGLSARMTNNIALIHEIKVLEFNMNKTGSIASMHRYHIMYNGS